MKNNKDDKTTNDTEGINANAIESNQSMALTIDYELYAHYLDSSDLTETQKHEFIDALWSIIVSFVDLGFGVHPVQQASSDPCGQLEIPAKFLPTESGDMVEFTQQSKSQFNDTIDRRSGLLDEGSEV